MKKFAMVLFAGVILAGIALGAEVGPASAGKAAVRFSVCDWTIGKAGDPTALALAGKLGFEGVQVSLEPAGEDLALMKEEARRAYMSAAETTGVAIASFAVGRLNDVPLKSDPRAEKWLEQALAIGPAMNVRIVLVPFFGKGDLRGDAAGIDAVIAALKRLAPKAEKAGMVLALESYLSAEENLKILAKAGSPAVRVYYDVANSTEVGLDIFKEIPALGAGIVEIHAKDNKDLYGKGNIDFVRVRAAMDAAGYAGWLVFEGTKYPLGRDESLKYDLDYLKGVFLRSGPSLIGGRFLTFNTVVRVRQIEVTRDAAEGPDESSVHTPAEARTFREAIADAWPGARITWAFSWLALHDGRESYRALRDLVVSYHNKFGDEITFIPGAYFANMYNTREQVNRDLHDGLRRVSEIVGGGYRPKSVVAGFLSAENLRYLAEEEGIHVCQGNIWSQYAVDNGDGEGSICYPYYPSRQHFLKPARGKDDFIDCVNLDGWTVDFLCARISGQRTVNGELWRSRQGVGPIETLLDMGTERGLQAMLATTAAHFDDGFSRNGFAWVTCGWEMCLVEGRKIYGYGGRNGMEGLRLWLAEIRRRWPDARLVTQGEFGELWRARFKANDEIDYRFVYRGSGIRASDADKEIRWFMNRDFRLALLRNWKENGPETVIDFTRYDLPAAEPADPAPGGHSRNWSLMNRVNQKGLRPQDRPIPLAGLTQEERRLIGSRYPELIKSP